MIYNDKNKDFLNDLVVANTLKNNLSNQYIYNYFKSLAISLGHEVDENNIKTSFKGEEFETVNAKLLKNKKKQVKNSANIREEITETQEEQQEIIETYHQVGNSYRTYNTNLFNHIFDNHLNDTKYFELINRENKFGDKIYSKEAIRTIDIIYKLITYLKPNTYINFIELDANDNYEKLLNSSIIYHHQNNNHVEKTNRNYNINNQIIKYFFDNKIIDEEEFKTTQYSVRIDSGILKNHETVIAELYNNYLAKYNLKAPRRDMVKIISKLNYLLEQIFGIFVDFENSKQKQYRRDGKVISTCQYPLEIGLNREYILKNFNYSYRTNILDWDSN